MTSPLDAERATASFSVQQLTHFLDGGRESTERKRSLRALVTSDPVFKNDGHQLDHAHQYGRSLEKAVRVQELVAQENLSEQEIKIVTASVGDSSPLWLHDFVFVPNLKGQCDDAQAAKWIHLAESYKIIGCYAQTELGHGSNIQALETTATYVPDTDEFDLHTPTATASKWWIGCMGKTATHAVLYAKLILRGEDLGVHSFLVQLRSLKDHTSLPGVEVGDIGPKLGSNAVDNGFLRLSHVRIPRDQMLMKYFKLSREGVYTKPPNMKLAYSTMVAVRASIVSSAATALSSAVCIGVRYSAVRRQFSDDSGAERPILDYTIQQYRLLSCLADSFALHFTGRRLRRTYETMVEEMNNGQFSSLGEVHATCAGLKALTTRMAVDGMEDCRKCLGGHGYACYSGLPMAIATYTQMCTVEGDNYLMAQQTARFLIKALQKCLEGTPSTAGTAGYLTVDVLEVVQNKCEAVTGQDLRNPTTQVKAYGHRAARLVLEGAQEMQRLVGEGKSFLVAWNAILVEVVAMSKAHCMYVMVTSCVEAVEEARRTHPELHAVLKTLSDLFALYHIEQDMGQFVEDGYFTRDQAKLVRTEVRALLRQLRPDAVALVDAYDIPDGVLNSALGRYDGRVYEALLESVKTEPLNATDVTEYYETHIRSMMRGPTHASKL